jgi:hypothetical protein
MQWTKTTWKERALAFRAHEKSEIIEVEFGRQAGRCRGIHADLCYRERETERHVVRRRGWKKRTTYETSKQLFNASQSASP